MFSTEHTIVTPYAEIFQNDGATTKKSVHVIEIEAFRIECWLINTIAVTYAILWANRRSCSLGRCKNQQMTIILILSYMAYSKDSELVTIKKSTNN